MTFRVIIATARGWDHYCADDAMVDAVEAAIGGITFDGAAPARGTDPVFEYKRVAIAWHESDQASSTDTNSSSTSGANSPRSPRNHSDLKPLGLFYIDYTSTVARSEIKVCCSQKCSCVLLICMLKLTQFLPCVLFVFRVADSR